MPQEKMNSKQAVIALSALAHDSRLAIYRLLIEHSPGELNAGAISKKLRIPKASLSFHLKEMSYAGLVSRRHDSRFMHYAAVIPAVNDLIDYLTGYQAAVAPAPIASKRDVRI